MPVGNIVRSSGLVGPAGRPNANSIRVDSDTDLLTFGTGASGTTEKIAVDQSSTQTLTNKTLTSPTITSPTISGAVTDSSVKNGPAPVNVTGQSSVAVAAATHAGKTVTVDEADGVTFTLPAATGTGNKYRFVITTTVTSNQVRFNVTGDDAYFGIINMLDLDGSAAAGFAAGADADQIDLNGTTKGGVKGDWIEFEDVKADTWAVRANLQVPAGSNPATPFATGQVS